MASSDPFVKHVIVETLSSAVRHSGVVQGETMAELADRLAPRGCSVVRFKRALGSLAFKDGKIVVIHQNPESVSSGHRRFIVRLA